MFLRLDAPAQLENEVLAFWKSQDVFKQCLEAREGAPEFVFFEGPPTANGLPHNGHVLTRVMKDVIPRYRSMKGFQVRRKGGWDTHGLPVEVEVEKGLGIHGKEAIEAYGLQAFSERCMNSVFTYINEWEELTEQIGFWVDTDEAYVTFHREYVESVWWALSRLFNKGLLYKGHKVVWWWPQGGTTLSAAEVGLGYKEVDDPAVTVRFRDADDPTVSYLAWTTTPWTLPSNVALAVGESIEYAYCEDENGETVVLAKDLAEKYDLTPSRVVLGRELLGRRYTPIFDFGAPEGGDAFLIVTGEHVTTSAGTGIVHTAPAFGEDDMKVAQTHSLGLLQWIKPDGTFADEAGQWAGVFCKDADKSIIRDLKERGLLFKRETYRHDYPFCWRKDDDPLIQYARPAWFIRTTARIDEAIQNNQEVGWLPGHIKDGRFGDFLRNNVDWALSRERFWGTPLNIWECQECETRIAPASTDEIAALNPDAFDPTVDRHLQVHKPWIDEIKLPCAECNGVMHRVPEVIDCWFDSGCMPFAQWGFPHKNVETFKKQYPADFICEAIDQTRGWFYSLLMISTLIFDEETCAEYDMPPVGLPRPYKNCVVLGHVCDMDGKKESKSKGNYTSPNLVLRGTTRLFVVADDNVPQGAVGMKRDQLKSLQMSPKERITLSKDREQTGTTIAAKLVEAKVGPKDTIHLNPQDVADLKLEGEPLTVWFAIPGEAPGADAFRWLFCAASPPWSTTRLSMKNIREGQREFLIRLRNVYQFFSIYANIAVEKGTFDPAGGAPRVPAERDVLDRWIHQRMKETSDEVSRQLDGYSTYDAARALLAFVDDLSNWYVRRSRSRFWGEGEGLQDALWTLYEVLCGTAKIIAPFVPFTAEALYQRLEVAFSTASSLSVHMEDWPEMSPVDGVGALTESMSMVRQLASLGLSARAASKVKVRQPLREATIVLSDASKRGQVEPLVDLLVSEWNVRSVVFADNAHDLVTFEVKPDFKKLGRKLGKKMKLVAAAMAGQDGSALQRTLDTEGHLVLQIDGEPIRIEADECIARVEPKGEFEAASGPVGVVALSTNIDEDLRAEGLVRELVNRLQNLRKEMDLGYTQRIRVEIEGDAVISSALDAYGDYLSAETLAQSLDKQVTATSGQRREWQVEGHDVVVNVQPV